MLEARPLCVCEIQHVLKGSQPNVSHHLKTLSEAGLVESKKDGLWIDYRLPDKPASPLHAGGRSPQPSPLGGRERAPRTICLCVPVPRPWMIRPCRKPWFDASSRYSSTTETTSFGEKACRSMWSSIGILCGESSAASFLPSLPLNHTTSPRIR